RSPLPAARRERRNGLSCRSDAFLVCHHTQTADIYTLSLHDALPILMIHTPTAISTFVCMSMVQLMAIFISMRCTLCGHFLQVALTLILVVGYAIAAS